MASWTSIPNSSLETGAPARSVDALAFRDNPIAIAEGAVGAPRIQTAGINDEAVTIEKCEFGLVPDFLESGTSFNIVDATFNVPDNTPVTTYRTYNLFGPGSATFYMNPIGDPSGSITVYVYLNGVLQYSQVFSDDPQNSGYRNITWSTKLGLVEVKASGNSAVNTGIRFRLYSNNLTSSTRVYV